MALNPYGDAKFHTLRSITYTEQGHNEMKLFNSQYKFWN